MREKPPSNYPGDDRSKGCETHREKRMGSVKHDDSGGSCAGDHPESDLCDEADRRCIPLLIHRKTVNAGSPQGRV